MGHVTQTPEFGREYYVANGQLGDRPALRWYSALARRYLGDGPILDVGCGTGFLLRRLSEQSEADGIEVSEFSAAMARETSPSSRIYADAKELDRNRYARVTSITSSSTSTMRHSDGCSRTFDRARLRTPGGWS